ncbi:MAG: phytanoyl-CoA dioxygenase [Bryobacteraceae bacterium]|nr:phytanoyl-CoA dioxygenase [Bryobacteraceae bacterium]
MIDDDQSHSDGLSDAQVAQFIQDGFIRIDRAFPLELAELGCAIMWRDIPFDPHDPTTWTKPVVRLDGYGGGPFEKAANLPFLHAAYDRLVGKGLWVRPDGLGTFPVRFPHPEDPGDLGWHVDASFPGEDDDPDEEHDFSTWRVNVTSRGRGLLMLFLFSDVGEFDAPTRIRVGSQVDMARFLEPAGEAGMSDMDLFEMGSDRPVAVATGEAGTVYLCHPFLVHTAQGHRGANPRFMAQQSLDIREPYQLHREDGAYSVVEISIRQALWGDSRS